MTKLIQFLIFVVICLGFSACSSPKKVITPEESPPNPDEWIKLSINEAVAFKFEKFDRKWSGTLRLYALDENDEKVVQRQFVSAEDSTWNDFSNFVEYLNLYEISPQNEIDGWYPDSGQLPKRVYRFELFDGEAIHSYTYQDPEKELIQYWQSQNVLIFVTFVQNDLNWREVESDKEKRIKRGNQDFQ